MYFYFSADFISCIINVRHNVVLLFKITSTRNKNLSLHYLSLSLSLSLSISLLLTYICIYDSMLLFKYTLPCRQKKNKSTLMLMESSTLTSPGESLPPWYYWWYKKVFFFVDVFDEVRDSANYVLWRDFFACWKPI